MWRSRSEVRRTALIAAVLVAAGVAGHVETAEPRRPATRAVPEGIAEAAETALPESVRAERLLVRNPADRTARLRAARAHLAEGADHPSRVEAAHAHAVAVLAEHPSDVQALLLAGQTSLLKGDPAGAVRYYQQATLADPSIAAAFLGLGDALTRLGDEPAARAAFASYRALMGMPALE